MASRSSGAAEAASPLVSRTSRLRGDITTSPSATVTLRSWPTSIRLPGRSAGAPPPAGRTKISAALWAPRSSVTENGITCGASVTGTLTVPPVTVIRGSTRSTSTLSRSSRPSGSQARFSTSTLATVPSIRATSSKTTGGFS